MGDNWLGTLEHKFIKAILNSFRQNGYGKFDKKVSSLFSVGNVKTFLEITG